ncbi:MAG: DUF1778 domain-containing protein [Bacteroidota bacterium]
MATLTIRLSDQQKEQLKNKALLEGKNVTEFLLEAAGGTHQRGTIHEAIKDLEEGRYEEYNSFDELSAVIHSW